MLSVYKLLKLWLHSSAAFHMISFAEGLKTYSSAVKQDNSEEYCELETFRPQCLKNEVIVIESAIYGRRYVSRCLETEELDFSINPGFIGCFSDVVSYLNSACSGKKQCEIRIPDANLQQTKPCPKGLDMFLEVYYACVEVVAEDRSCVVTVSSNPVHIARSDSGSASPSNSGLHCGTRSQPWMLEAPSGQRINISLLDFSSSILGTKPPIELRTQEPSRLSRIGSDAAMNGRCSTHSHRTQPYGFIIDKAAAAAGKKNVSICSNADSQKLTNVYLSSSNVVELVLENGIGNNASANFMLRIEDAAETCIKTVGCSDLIPPEDAWLKRTDNTAIVGCYTSRQTWYLKCEGHQWTGVVSNCTSHAVLEDLAVGVMSSPVTDVRGNEVLLMVAVAFVGLAVCLMIVCYGIYCLRRYSTDKKLCAGNSYSTKYSHTQTDCNFTVTKHRSDDIHEAAVDSRMQQQAPHNGAKSGTHGTATPDWNATASAQYFVLDQNEVARDAHCNI